MYLHKDETFKYVLYNIRTNEYFNVEYIKDDCDAIYNILMDYKKNGRSKKPKDDQFLKENRAIMFKFLNLCTAN